MCLAFKAAVDVYFFAGTSGQFCSPDISGIKEDIAIIQSTLEQKLTEGRTISGELDRAKKEKKTLAQENLRLNHRIAYLEDQTNELQEGLRQVRDSLSRTLNTTDIIQVSSSLRYWALACKYLLIKAYNLFVLLPAHAELIIYIYIRLSLGWMLEVRVLELEAAMAAREATVLLLYQVKIFNFDESHQT